MSKIVWDATGERLYETGVDHGVLYTSTGENGAYAAGVAWNGLTAVNESPSGAEATALYADNIKYLNLVSNEEFGGTIEAYTYPEEFEVCDGSASVADGLYVTQQTRKEFGFTYRTKIGNDVDGDAHGYKIHIVYGALASPSDKDHSTVNDSPEAVTFSWEFTTTPVAITTESGLSASEVAKLKPTAHIVIDSTKATEGKLTALEALLYGTNGEGQQSGTDPQLPSIDTVISTLS